MGQSLVQIYVHVVFSTKDRAPLILPEVRADLYGFLGEYLNRADCPCVAIGGVEDHVHLLFKLGKDAQVQDVVGGLKSRSSSWIKGRDARLRRFYWQRGYAAFSISSIHLAAARRYIDGQQRHHRKESFEAELRRILKKCEMEYDEAYLLT